MSVDAQAEVLIERPREDVAAVMFDPKCDKLWIGGLINVFRLTPGLLRKDSRVEHVAEFLSKRYSAMILVTKDEPGRMIEMSANEPFEMKIIYQLDDADGGTKATVRIQSIGEIEYKQPAVMLNKLVSEKITNDLKKLKKHMENAVD